MGWNDGALKYDMEKLLDAQFTEMMKFEKDLLQVMNNE